MGMVRNCKEIGENLQLIIKRLMANDNLIKYLYYSDPDPLSGAILTDEQKKKEIYEKLIRITPRIGADETAKSIVAVRAINGINLDDNPEFRTVTISIEVITPLSQWIIKSTNLRPFAIMGEIQESLNKKTINGLGKMIGGDFELSFLTEEVSCYEMKFAIVTYD